MQTGKNTGTTYCSDPSIPSVVLKGLAEHKVTLGAPLCPCRHYEDKEVRAAPSRRPGRACVPLLWPGFECWPILLVYRARSSATAIHTGVEGGSHSFGGPPKGTPTVELKYARLSFYSGMPRSVFTPSSKGLCSHRVQNRRDSASRGSLRDYTSRGSRGDSASRGSLSLTCGSGLEISPYYSPPLRGSGAWARRTLLEL